MSCFFRSSCILSKHLKRGSTLLSAWRVKSLKWCSDWVWLLYSSALSTGTSKEEARAMIWIAFIFQRWLPSFESGTLNMLHNVTLSSETTCFHFSISVATISILILNMYLLLSAASFIRLFMTSQQRFRSFAISNLGVKSSLHWTNRVVRSRIK